MHKSNMRSFGRIALGSALLLSTAFVHPGRAQAQTSTTYLWIGDGAAGGGGIGGAGGGGGGSGSIYAGGAGGGGRATGSHYEAKPAKAGAGGVGGYTVGTYGETVLNNGTVSIQGTNGIGTANVGGANNTNGAGGYSQGGGAGLGGQAGGHGGSGGGAGYPGRDSVTNSSNPSVVVSSILVSGAATFSATFDSGATSFDVVSVGGSGGGGGGGGDQGSSGGGAADGSPPGTPGFLAINDGGTVTVGDLLVGGNGGGGGGEGEWDSNGGTAESNSTSNYSGGDGGNGSAGIVQVSGPGSVLEVERYAILGGANGQQGAASGTQGDNGASYGSGGLGASGTLSLMNGGILDLTGYTSSTGTLTGAVVETAAQYLKDTGDIYSTLAAAGAFNISGAGTILVANGNSATVEASITDGSTVGTLVASGGGTLMLTAGEDGVKTAVNAYSGGTDIIDSTTVDAQSAGDLGTGEILLNGGTLQNAVYSAVNHTGAIAANAAGHLLALDGSQSLVVGASNGTVDTNGGTVEDGSITNQTTLGGTLYVINKDASSTGTLSLGTGGTLALNNGNGILDLGASTTQSPSANAVVLDLSNTTSSNVGGLDGTTESGINLGSGTLAALTINGGGLYQGTLSGAGSLIENASTSYTTTSSYSNDATEILTNASDNYTGSTTVETGMLVVGYQAGTVTIQPQAATSDSAGNSDTDTASIAGSKVTVETGGTLRGYGTVGTTTNNGLVYTGFSGYVPGVGYYSDLPGALTVGGDYTQSSTGTLEIDVEPNKNTIQPQYPISTHQGDVLLRSPGQITALTSAEQEEAAPLLGYGDLVVNGVATLAGTLAVNPGWEAEAGRTYDGVLVATGGIMKSFAQSIVAGSSPYAPYLVVNTTYTGHVDNSSTGSGSGSANINMGASQLQIDSGRFYAASGFVQNQSLFDVLSAPYTGTVPTANDAENGYWMRGLGSFGHDDGFDYNYKGFVLGRGFAVNPNLTVGLGLSNVYTNTTGENSSHINGISVGGELYAAYTQQAFKLVGTAAAGYLSDKGSRNLPGVGTGKFSPDGAYEGVSGRAQYTLQENDNAFVIPFAQISYVHTNLGSATESFAQQESAQGLLSYRYGSLSTSVAQAEAGIDVGFNRLTTHGMFTGWAGLAGLGSVGSKNASLSETMGLDTYNVSGRVASGGAFAPSVGMQLAGVNQPWAIAADWSGRFASNSAGQAFMLQGNYKW